ncbi:Uncharacterised protein [Raoultella terrigena]|nr:Uncharacterised protein [Raoultella terrigena]
MKMITSMFFLSFAFYANASIQIYASDTSVLVLEKIRGKSRSYFDPIRRE